MTCKARRHSDQMLCGPCGLAWDVNDPDRPECRGGARDCLCYGAGSFTGWKPSPSDKLCTTCPHAVDRTVNNG